MAGPETGDFTATLSGVPQNLIVTQLVGGFSPPL